MQRIGFDRIDFPLRPPALEQLARNSEGDAADQRHRECQNRIERKPRRQPLAALQVEKQLVQEIDGVAHQRNHQTGDHTDQRRQQDEARFTRSARRRAAAAVFRVWSDFGGQVRLGWGFAA
jgi:hypothetical protein